MIDSQIVLPKRFLEKVIVTDTCWLWNASKNNYGYGRFGLKGKTVTAHRFSYSCYYGTIPNNMLVLHKCDVPSCVNPNHLFLGTSQDNMDDMRLKGRQNGPKGQRNGHSKLTQDQVDEIRRTYKICGRWGKETEFSSDALAKKYGVTRYQIYSIIYNKSWAKSGETR
jgi:hypothetical protein